MKLLTTDIFIVPPFVTVLSDTAARSSSKHLGAQTSSGLGDLEQVDCNIRTVMNVFVSVTKIFHRQLPWDVLVCLSGWLAG